MTAILAALLLLEACSFASPPRPPSLQEERASPASGYRYLLYRPAGYEDSTGTWPLILFLHGGGERGKNLASVKREALPRWLEDWKRFPFVVVSPQESRRGEFRAERLDILLEEVLAENRIDPGRVYVTGLSSGAFAALELAIFRPERFAAIAVVSNPRIPEDLCALSKIPVWIFHGARDERVPVRMAHRLRAALEACGGRVELTAYDGDGHDAWTRAYRGPDLYDWLQEQGRKIGD
jgi:predicted peptidase